MIPTLQLGQFGRTSSRAVSGVLGSPANLWAAYGLTLLVTGYGGSALRVRRSSDNTEQDIGLIAGILDTASLATFVGANDGFVVKWYDQSGAANDIANATASAQPQIVDAGTYLSEVIFNGTSNRLDTTNNSGTTATFSVYLAGRHLIGSTTTATCVFSHGSSSSPQVNVQRNTVTSNADNFQTDAYADGTAPSSNTVDAALTISASTHAFIFDRAQATAATEATVWIAGVQHASVASSGTCSGNYTPGIWKLGANTTDYSRIALTAFLIYEAAHASGDIGTISTAVKPPAKTDTVDSYTTNLWGLYGLRRLLSTYAGNCVKIRRSSDDTTSNIGFDATTKLIDAAAIATFVGANSGYVETWYDQSGGTKDFTQVTLTKQPRLVNAGVLDRGLTFDGSNDFMLTGNSGTPTGITIHWRGSNEADPAVSSTMLSLSLSYDSNRGLNLYRNASDQANSAVGQTVSYATLGYTTNPVGQVVSVRGDRTQVTAATVSCLFSGGVKLTAANNYSSGVLPSGNYNANPWYLGGVSTLYFMTGEVDTIAIYETAQTDATVNQVARAIG